MNTLTIDQALYDGAALYARQNNMSIQKVIELGVKLLLTNVRHSNTKANDMELEEALRRWNLAKETKRRMVERLEVLARESYLQ